MLLTLVYGMSAGVAQTMAWIHMCDWLAFFQYTCVVIGWPARLCHGKNFVPCSRPEPNFQPTDQVTHRSERQNQMPAIMYQHLKGTSRSHPRWPWAGFLGSTEAHWAFWLGSFLVGIADVCCGWSYSPEMLPKPLPGYIDVDALFGEKTQKWVYWYNDVGLFWFAVSLDLFCFVHSHPECSPKPVSARFQSNIKPCKESCPSKGLTTPAYYFRISFKNKEGMSQALFLPCSMECSKSMTLEENKSTLNGGTPGKGENSPTSWNVLEGNLK